MKKLFAAVVVAVSLISGSAFAQVAGISTCAGGTLAVTSASANVQLSSCGQTVIVYNIGSTEAFYNTGTTNAVTATAQSGSTAAPAAGSYSLPSGSFVTLNPVGFGSFLAAITASSTTTLRIVQGTALP